VPLAFALRNYWALVAGAIASRAAATAISYIAHPFRPRFSLAEIGSLLGFSRWLLLNNVITFFKERTSDFLVGRLHGATTLGVYSISYELANMPMTELSAPVNRALLPGFAKLGDADEASALYAKTVGMLAFVAVPAAGGIFAVAPFLVPALLGPKWLAATAVIEVLAFNGALLLFHSGICAMLIARGFPRQVTITNAVYVAILVLGLALTVPQFGAIGAAHAALTASVLSTPVYLAHVYRRLRVSPLSLLRAVARPVLAAAVMIVVVRSALPAFELSLSASAALGLLLGGITLGIAVYAVAGFLLWLASGRPDGPERFLLTRAMAWLTGLARRGRHRAS
jgi:PST family polysaccharide transporter